MDLILNQNFSDLTEEEKIMFEGGATVGQAVAATIGIAAICWAAPVAVVVGTGVGIGMAVAGAGAVVNLMYD